MAKAKTLRILMIMLSVVTFLVSCSNNADINNNTKSDEDITLLSDEPFTLIMLQNHQSGSSNADTYIDSIEMLLKEKRININIDIVPRGTSADSIKEEYKKYVKAKLGSSENVAFMGSFFSRDEMNEMAYSGQILEISDLYKEYAHNYYIDTYGDDVKRFYYENCIPRLFVADEDKNKIYGIPVGAYEDLNYTALLVRKEIAEEYGKDIDTIDDYENLLKWIKSKDTQYKPGLLPFSISGYFDLWAHLNGYSDVAGQAGRIGGSSSGYYYRNSDIDSIIRAGGVDVVDAVKLPDFKEYMMKLVDWKESELVDFWASYDLSSINPRDYATIVTNLSYYMRPENVSDKRTFVNAKDYDMYLLNKAGLRYSTCKSIQPYYSSIYVGANSKNPREVFKFIEWLYGEQQNYDLFMNGEKTEENGIDADRLYWGQNQFSYFKNIKFDKGKDYYPGNWEDILIKISEIPARSEISLYYYVKKNTTLDYFKLDELYKNKTYELPEDEKTSYNNLIINFFNELYNAKDIDIEELVDKYIKDVSGVEGVQKQKAGYYKFFNALFECLKSNSK